MAEYRIDGYWEICPHCDERFGDCDEWARHSGERGETVECEQCGKKYKRWAEYSVDYHTEAVSDD